MNAAEYESILKEMYPTDEILTADIRMIAELMAACYQDGANSKPSHLQRLMLSELDKLSDNLAEVSKPRRWFR